jgi:hypothetical protein
LYRLGKLLQLLTAPLGYYHSESRLRSLLELVPGLNFGRIIERKFDVEVIWAAFNVMECDRLAMYQLRNSSFLYEMYLIPV